jgi:hypothetical protein
MAEVDLDAAPRTLRFFHNDKQQTVVVTHIPEMIDFAVCVLLVLLPFTSIQVTSYEKDNSFTFSLQEVTTCTGQGLSSSNACEYGGNGGWTRRWNPDTKMYEVIE